MVEEKSEWDRVKEAFSQQELLAFSMGDVWRNMLKSLTGFKEALDSVGNTTEKMANESSRNEEGIENLKAELLKGLQTLKEVSQTTPEMFEKTSMFLVADYILWTKAFLPFFLLASIIPAVLGLIFSEFTNVNLPIISLLPPWVGSFIAMMLISVWLWRSITLLAKRLYSLVITFLPGVAQYFYNLLFIPEEVKLTGIAFLGAGILSISVIALGISFGLGIMELLLLFSIVGLFTFFLIKFTSVLSKVLGSSLIFIIIIRALNAAIESSLGLNIMSMTALQSIFFIGTLLGFVMWFDLLVHLTLIISLNVSAFLLRKTMTTGIAAVFGLDADTMKDVFGTELGGLVDEVADITQEMIDGTEDVLNKYRKIGKGTAVVIKNVDTGKKAILPAASKLVTDVKKGVSKTQRVTMKLKDTTNEYTVASLDENTHQITHTDASGVKTTHTVSGPLQDIGATIAKTFGLKGKFTTTTTNVMEAGLGEGGEIQAVSKFNREHITNVQKDSNGKLFFDVMGKKLSFDPATGTLGRGSTTASLSKVKGKTKKSAVDDILSKVNDKQLRKATFGLLMEDGTDTKNIFKEVGSNLVLDQDKVAESFEKIAARAMDSYNEHDSVGKTLVMMSDDSIKVGSMARLLPKNEDVLRKNGAVSLKKLSKSEFEIGFGGKKVPIKVEGNITADAVDKIVKTLSRGKIKVGTDPNAKGIPFSLNAKQMEAALKNVSEKGQPVSGIPDGISMNITTTSGKSLLKRSKKQFEFKSEDGSKIIIGGGDIGGLSQIAQRTKLHDTKGHLLTPELKRFVGNLDQVMKRHKDGYKVKLHGDRTLILSKTRDGYGAIIPNKEGQPEIKEMHGETLTDVMLQVGKNNLRVEGLVERKRNPIDVNPFAKDFNGTYKTVKDLESKNYAGVMSGTVDIKSIDPANLTNVVLGELGTDESNIKRILNDENAKSAISKIKGVMESNKDGRLKTVWLGDNKMVAVADKEGNEVYRAMLNKDVFAEELKKGDTTKSTAHYTYKIGNQEIKKKFEGSSIKDAISKITSDDGLSQPGAQVDSITQSISQVSRVVVNPQTSTRQFESVRSGFLGRDETHQSKFDKVKEKLDQSRVLAFRVPDKSRSYVFEKVDGIGTDNYIVSTKDARGRTVEYLQIDRDGAEKILESGINFRKWEHKTVSKRQISDIKLDRSTSKTFFKRGGQQYSLDPATGVIERPAGALPPLENIDPRNIGNVTDAITNFVNIEETHRLGLEIEDFVEKSRGDQINPQTFDIFDKAGRTRFNLSARGGKLYMYMKSKEHTGNPWEEITPSYVMDSIRPEIRPSGTPPSSSRRGTPPSAPPSGTPPGSTIPSARIPGPPITPAVMRRDPPPTLVTPPGETPLGDRDLTKKKGEPETLKGELSEALEKQRKRIKDQEKQGIKDVQIKYRGGKDEVKRNLKEEEFPEPATKDPTKKPKREEVTLKSTPKKEKTKVKKELAQDSDVEATVRGLKSIKDDSYSTKLDTLKKLKEGHKPTEKEIDRVEESDLEDSRKKMAGLSDGDTIAPIPVPESRRATREEMPQSSELPIQTTIKEIKNREVKTQTKIEELSKVFERKELNTRERNVVKEELLNLQKSLLTKPDSISRPTPPGLKYKPKPEELKVAKDKIMLERKLLPPLKEEEKPILIPEVLKAEKEKADRAASAVMKKAAPEELKLLPAGEERKLLAAPEETKLLTPGEDRKLLTAPKETKLITAGPKRKLLAAPKGVAGILPERAESLVTREKAAKTLPKIEKSLVERWEKKGVQDNQVKPNWASSDDFVVGKINAELTKLRRGGEREKAEVFKKDVKQLLKEQIEPLLTDKSRAEEISQKIIDVADERADFNELSRLKDKVSLEKRAEINDIIRSRDKREWNKLLGRSVTEETTISETEKVKVQKSEEPPTSEVKRLVPTPPEKPKSRGPIFVRRPRTESQQDSVEIVTALKGAMLTGSTDPLDKVIEDLKIVSNKQLGEVKGAAARLQKAYDAAKMPEDKRENAHKALHHMVGKIDAEIERRNAEAEKPSQKVSPTSSVKYEARRRLRSALPYFLQNKQGEERKEFEENLAKELKDHGVYLEDIETISKQVEIELKGPEKLEAKKAEKDAYDNWAGERVGEMQTWADQRIKQGKALPPEQIDNYIKDIEAYKENIGKQIGPKEAEKILKRIRDGLKK